jgi:hypothetical protein
VENEPAIALYRASDVDGLFCDVGSAYLNLQLFEYIRKMQIHGAVDDYTHGAVGGVLADIGDGMEKIGILEPWHGNEEVIGQIGIWAHES